MRSKLLIVSVSMYIQLHFASCTSNNRWTNRHKHKNHQSKKITHSFFDGVYFIVPGNSGACTELVVWRARETMQKLIRDQKPCGNNV